MLIIGERINSTRKEVYEAIKSRNAAFLERELDRQIRGGANFIDINCAVTSQDEVQDMDWVISVIQSKSQNVNLCIDSPNFLAISKAMQVYKGTGELMINSITGEESRIKTIVPLAVLRKTKLIALALDDRGMPNTADERVEITQGIIEKVQAVGFNKEDLYIDPLIRPISTEPDQAKEFLNAITRIKSLGVKVVCGLSNVSYGLPDRVVINSTFLAMAMLAGLDAAILDISDKHISSIIAASRAILCQDENCVRYIKAFREGKLI